MTLSDACVFIVDDDELIRDSLKQRVKSLAQLVRSTGKAGVHPPQK